MIKFSESHEWIRSSSLKGRVGITHHASEQLGEVVYIELPKIGKKIKKGDEVAVVESTKAASDIYSPASGEIVAVNEALLSNPALIHHSPEEKGWLFEIQLSDPTELDTLLNDRQYVQLIS